MPPATAPFFRELYELYRLTYFVYHAGDELRAIAQDHPLLRYLRDLDALKAGGEFLQEYANYDGTDPPLTTVRLALTRYHDALNQAIRG